MHLYLDITVNTFINYHCIYFISLSFITHKRQPNGYVPPNAFKINPFVKSQHNEEESKNNKQTNKKKKNYGHPPSSDKVSDQH